MATSNSIHAQVVQKVQECLKELGFEPEGKISEHEGVVFARREVHGECIRVVLHITDREPRTAQAGIQAAELMSHRRAQVAIRPTLAAQAASRTLPDAGTRKGDCE